MLMISANILCLIVHVHVLAADMISYIDLSTSGTDFIPANAIELLGTHLSIASAFKCALLCHKDPQCRTFVFDSSICQVYQGSLNTGSIVLSSSPSRVVGGINYNKINVISAYNQSCDHCYPDRYLVCRNNTCQCPSGTFYDNQGSCINQIYVNSTVTCENNNWCNEDLNLTCQCGQCQCPVGSYWKSKTCVPQLLVGAHCNSSEQCRNDLNLVCSRQNKTCIPMKVMTMPVISGILPNKFSYVGMSFNTTNYEWWRGFDNKTNTYWNRMGTDNVLDYIFITFDDTYLLNSMKLTVGGDGTHDPQTLAIYSDENGTCFQQSFWFPKITNGSFTFAPRSFNTSARPLVTNHLLISIERWSIYQTYLFELTFYGGLY